MEKFIILLFCATLFIGCRTTKVSEYKNNTEQKDSITTVFNDSTSISTITNINITDVEDITTVIKEDITEVIKDSVNRTTTERIISRVIEQTKAKDKSKIITEQTDTTYIINETTEVIKDNKVIEENKEVTKKSNVMLWVFLSLLCIVVLVIVVKFF